MKVGEAASAYAESRNAVVLALSAVNEALGEEDFDAASSAATGIDPAIEAAQKAKTVYDQAVAENPEEAPEQVSSQ